MISNYLYSCKGLFTLFALFIPIVQVVANPNSENSQIEQYKSKIQLGREYRHEVKGCPENSFCNEHVGKLYLEYEQLMEQLLSATKHQEQLRVWKSVNAFKNKYGIPLSFITSKTYEQLPEQINAIGHDIECPEREKVTPNAGATASISNKIPLQKFSFFIKNLSELKDIEFIGDTYEITTHKKVYRFELPKGETPLYFNKESLLFIKEEMGNYFWITVKDNQFDFYATNPTKNHKLEEKNKIQYESCVTPIELESKNSFFDKVSYKVKCFKIWDQALNRWYSGRKFESCAQ